MRKFSLSIIVPVTQMADRLENLESWIFEASDLGIQVLLVHDFRDTKTSIQLQALVRRLNDSKVMFFEGKYGNQGLARNKGITHSEGKWISFWDSDDFGNPRNLLNAVTLASAETDIVIGQYDSVNPSLDVLSKSYTKHLRNVPKNVGIWRMAFRADRFEGVQFPELQMAEDQVYFARCLLKSEKVEIVGDSFYSYVQGNLGQVTLNMEALRQIPIAIKLLLQLIPRTRNPSKAIIILTMSLRLFITNLKRRFRSG